MESGFYYLNSRYYDPEVGRFINCDDTEILKLTQGTLNGANLFAYCNNDPVLNSDPSGNIAMTPIKTITERLLSIVYNIFKKLLNKIGVEKTSKYLIISASLLASLIDTLAMVKDVLMPVVAVGIKLSKKIFREALKSVVLAIFKYNRKNVVSFIKREVIPVVARELSKILKKCFQMFMIRFKLKKITSFTKDQIISAMLKNTSFDRWYRAFGSAGKIIAAIFDMIDGNWNGSICIPIKSK